MAGVPGKGGKPGRSGRKSKAHEMGLQALLDKCWKQRQREKVIKTPALRAEPGDLEAIKLLMAYKFGKPTERYEHSGIDGEPIRTISYIQPVKPDNS